MKRKWPPLFQSTLFRYMASYTMIMLVLVLGAGMFIGNTYANSIRESAIETQINKLDKIRTENEKYFDAMLNIANQISLSPYIKPFRFEEEPEQAYHLKKQLVPYTVTNSFINQLYLLFAEDSTIYSSFTSMPLDLFLNDMMRFERVTPEAMLALLRSKEPMNVLPCQMVNSVLLDGNDAMMATVIAAIGAGNNGASGSVVFMIKQSVYHDLFKDVIYQARNTYIFHGDTLFVADTPLAVSPETIAAEMDKDGTAELSIQGENYLLISQTGARHHMRYATLFPLSAIQADIYKAQNTAALFLLALAIPCMFLIYYLSKRHVKPLREISRHFSLDDRDELHAIRSGIETLNAKITDSLPALRSSFILNLIKGRYHTRQEIVKQGNALSLCVDKRFFMAVLLSVLPDEDDSFPMDKICLGHPSTSGYGAELISKEQFLLLLFADEAHALTNRVESILGEEDCVLALCGSEVYSDFTKFDSAYLEASARFDHLAAKDDMHAQRFTDIRQNTVPEQAIDGDKAQAYPFILEAITYMDENAFDPNLSMAAVAEAFELSAVRFSLNFKEVTGMSPSEYLLRMRMDKAQILLVETDDSIKDICAQVGYYDASGFIRRFKRYMGITPMQYRQNNK